MEVLTPNKPDNRFYWFLIAVCLLVLIIMCNSCSCDYHLSRIKKKCNTSFQSDTIRIQDTIFIKESRVDTLFKRTSDTVRINNDRLHIKYFYNNHDSTVYIQGKCDSLIVYRDKYVVTNNTEFKPDLLKGWKWGILGIFLALLLLLILKK